MTCSLCGQRRARRHCPALGREICAFCCGSKRLVEIACPADCAYLASAREHPPAAALRQRQQDAGVLRQAARDLNERQSQLFFALSTFIVRYQGPEFHPLIDEDVAEAAASLAATLETSARGVIYEHRPVSLPAERLTTALKPLLAEAGQGRSAFERDAAVVFRRIEEAARMPRGAAGAGRRAFLELLGRVIRPAADETEPDRSQRAPEPRVIIP